MTSELDTVKQPASDSSCWTLFTLPWKRDPWLLAEFQALDTLTGTSCVTHCCKRQALVLSFVAFSPRKTLHITRVYLFPNDVFAVEKRHQPVKTATNVAPRSRIS